ncbi:MAG TPA: hypothetical protein VM513_08075 [Kofleriaceae bacterium]|nr:hypothetical protein [Kofleriaceae bacterium]
MSPVRSVTHVPGADRPVLAPVLVLVFVLVLALVLEVARRV